MTEQNKNPTLESNALHEYIGPVENVDWGSFTGQSHGAPLCVRTYGTDGHLQVAIALPPGATSRDGKRKDVVYLGEGGGTRDEFLRSIGEIVVAMGKAEMVLP